MSSQLHGQYTATPGVVDPNVLNKKMDNLNMTLGDKQVLAHRLRRLPKEKAILAIQKMDTDINIATEAVVDAVGLRQGSEDVDTSKTLIGQGILNPTGRRKFLGVHKNAVSSRIPTGYTEISKGVAALNVLNPYVSGTSVEASFIDMNYNNGNSMTSFSKNKN